MFRSIAVGIVVFVSAFALAQEKPDQKLDSYYKLGPDSMKQEGVPTGHVDGPHTIASEAYPEHLTPIRCMFRPSTIRRSRLT